MISEYYVVRLQCDFAEHKIEHGEGEAEFHGKESSGCYAQARKAGWRVYLSTRRARCPECAKKMLP